MGAFRTFFGGNRQFITQVFAPMVVALLFFSFAAPAQAQLTYTNTTDGPISETVTTCAAPLVRTFNVTTSFTISDVNIGILLAHTYRSDLQFYLKGPDGTRISLQVNSGGSVDNENVLFDDAAAASITTHATVDTAIATTIVPPYQRTFRPVTALSAFNGKNALGTWTVEICDSVAQDAGTFYQADLFLTATTTLLVDKSSTLMSDPQNGLTSPKAIPGAVIRYCILITNAGVGTATTVAASDPLPATMTFVPGSIRSGTSCAAAATVEDDNNSGTDETDPYGASFAGTTLSATTASMASAATFAITFDATVN
jgi:uncharacterized repeat protein (TIGR01451 family)